MGSKDENYWKVLDAVLRLEVVKGHLRWKISDLSRLSGMQRTLIYYYFGKSKENILSAALKTIGEEVIGIGPARMKMWREGRVRESLLQSRQLLQKAPHLAEFYFHWRHRDSELKSLLLAQERSYLAKLRLCFPKLKEEDVRAIHAIFFSVVFFPDLPEPVIDRILARLPLPPNG